jgi:geranylgeranylglycerol-phosphate geranylgeranyltransferase
MRLLRLQRPLLNGLLARSHIPASLEILRPLNVVLTCAAVLLGGWLSSHSLSVELFLASLAAALIAAAGYIHNDIIDLPVDRVSHPLRALPSGRMSVAAAWMLSVALGTLGLGIPFLLPLPCVWVGIATILVLLLYNFRLKHFPLAGNIAVALLGGIPILFGGLAVGDPYPALLPGILAAAVHLAREILKDLQDSEGDLLAGSHTLPHAIGPTGSRTLVTLILASLLIAIPLPGFLLVTGPVYLIFALLLDVIILLVFVHLWGAQTSNELETPSRLLKLVLLIGLGAFLADALSI